MRDKRIKLFGLKVTLTLTVLSVFLADAQSKKASDLYFDWGGELSTDHSYFFKDGLYEGQHNYFASVALKPKFSVEWNAGSNRLVSTFFGRLNGHDKNRSHVDIRELYYQKLKDHWEISVGLKEIYWGVSESSHLVNVINQTDWVESVDQEQKLGQPMIHFTYLTNNSGIVDLFALPYHRTRVFQSKAGRMRFPFVVKDKVVYESDAKAHRLDFAARWSHSFHVFDVGVSHFYGTNREPILHLKSDNTLEQYYEIMNQTGIDVQITTGAWLIKFEGIRRETNGSTFVASNMGLEFTFGNINHKGLDLSFLSEYLFDDRGNLTTTGFQNDVFVGSRIALNDNDDTSILIGGIFDLEYSSQMYTLEAERRFYNNFRANLELRIYNEFSENDLFYPLREDHFMKFSLGYHF